MNSEVKCVTPPPVSPEGNNRQKVIIMMRKAINAICDLGLMSGEGLSIVECAKVYEAATKAMNALDNGLKRLDN